MFKYVCVYVCLHVCVLCMRVFVCVCVCVVCVYATICVCIVWWTMCKISIRDYILKSILNSCYYTHINNELSLMITGLLHLFHLLYSSSSFSPSSSVSSSSSILNLFPSSCLFPFPFFMLPFSCLPPSSLS